MLCKFALILLQGRPPCLLGGRSDFQRGAVLYHTCGHTGSCIYVLIKVFPGLLSYEESSCTETGVGVQDTGTVCSGPHLECLGSPTLPWTAKPPTLPSIPSQKALDNSGAYIALHTYDLLWNLYLIPACGHLATVQSNLLDHQQSLGLQGAWVLCSLIRCCWCCPSWPSWAGLVVAITFAGDKGLLFPSVHAWPSTALPPRVGLLQYPLPRPWTVRTALPPSLGGFLHTMPGRVDMSSASPESRCGSASQGTPLLVNSFCRFLIRVPDNMEEIREGPAAPGCLA